MMRRRHGVEPQTASTAPSSAASVIARTSGAPCERRATKAAQQAAQASSAANGQNTPDFPRATRARVACTMLCRGRGRAAQKSRSLTRSRAIDWLCSWQTRDSVTFSTAAISFRFMSCS